ncbi:MAG: RHS repeat-associated core domain-containing protein [Leptothrix sp. (in: b-proteobacteria)]
MTRHPLTRLALLLVALWAGHLPGAQAQGTPSGVMTWAYGYDAQGNPQTAVDGLGLSTETLYDRLNRPKQITQPLPAAGVARPVIKPGWDGANQLQNVTDPRNLLTSYVRTGLGDTTNLFSPDTGSTGATYDAAGNLATRTDARGKQVVYSYDALNRLTQVHYPTGTDNVYTYDVGVNERGMMTGFSDESGSTSYVHDGLGRVTVKTQSVTSPATLALTVTYNWGTAGVTLNKLQSLKYPSGAQLSYSYDAAGRISALSVYPVNANGVGTSTASLVLLSGVTYTAWNEAKGWMWTSTRTPYSRTWDSYGRPLSYDLGGPYYGMTRTLGYDDAGRITSYTHTKGSTALPAYDQSFGYDGLGRLIGATQGATGYAYSYDASGNRLTYQVGATTLTNQVSPTSNRLSSVQRVSLTTGSIVTDVPAYDAAGNTTGNGSAGSAVYSDRGRLATSNVPITGGTSAVAYRYNALEQRVSKAGTLVPSGAAYYVYDEANHLLGEYDASGMALYEVIWLGEQPVGVIKQIRTGSGSTLNVSTRLDNIFADHLNAPRVITYGSVLWRWDSTEPFGVTPANENPAGQGAYPFNLRFPGQVYDRETTGHYNLNRDYSAWVGRYMQSDPIGLQGGINTYSYVDSNPLSDTDPLGLFKYHGNWCGPNWTGGFEKPWDKLTDAEKKAVKPPIDKLDACCQVHDTCHADCRAQFPCDMNAQKRCLESCDRRLYYCSRQSGEGSFWLEDYMRKSSPAPENCCPTK